MTTRYIIISRIHDFIDIHIIQPFGFRLCNDYNCFRPIDERDMRCLKHEMEILEYRREEYEE